MTFIRAVRMTADIHSTTIQTQTQTQRDESCSSNSIDRSSITCDHKCQVIQTQESEHGNVWTITLGLIVNNATVHTPIIVSTTNTSQVRTVSVESGMDAATLFVTIQSYTTVTERLVESS